MIRAIGKIYTETRRGTSIYIIDLGKAFNYVRWDKLMGILK